MAVAPFAVVGARASCDSHGFCGEAASVTDVSGEFWGAVGS